MCQLPKNRANSTPVEGLSRATAITKRKFNSPVEFNSLLNQILEKKKNQKSTLVDTHVEYLLFYLL